MDYNLAKFIHIIAILGWVSSTTSMGIYFLYTLIRPPDCPQDQLRSFYRWMVNLEALSLLVLIFAGSWMLHLIKFKFDINWLNIKLAIVFSFILPLEIINLWFVNFYIPKAEDKQRAYRIYDLFVLIVSLPLTLAILGVVYLAVFKP
ncbi:MAG: hypothetical protein ABDH18_05160, partial [Aquificaceae bacterium]